VSYTVDWFIPNGSEPLEEQAERASSGRWLPASPAAIALLQSVAREIQSLDSTLELHPSARGGDGYWIGSDDPDCLVPYVELGNGTAMVQGGLGPDDDFNDALLRVYSILEHHGFVGYDLDGKIFHGVKGAIKLQTGRSLADFFRHRVTELDTVRVEQLLKPNRAFDGTEAIKRAPQSGDVGTVVHVHHQDSTYTVEAVDSNGNTLWLADFVLEELSLVAKSPG
jgi:hypothetical protein